VPGEGYIETNRIVAFPSLNENIAGLGIALDAPTHNFSMTRIRRYHTSIPSISTFGSIHKYWEIQPTAEGPVQWVYTSYFNSDVIGNESTFQHYIQPVTSGVWLPNGGQVQTSTQRVVNATFLSLPSCRITIASASSGATCSLTDPNYIEAVFLVPSAAYVSDTVFVRSIPPSGTAVDVQWNFGNGIFTAVADTSIIYTVPGNYEVTYQITNGVCADIQRKNIIIEIPPPQRQGPQGIARLLQSIEVYPNPVPRVLFIDVRLTEALLGTTTIINSVGKVVYRKEEIGTSFNTEIDTDVWPNGMYLLSFQVADKTLWYKLVKE
jgi:hypothetical protein